MIICLAAMLGALLFFSSEAFSPCLLMAGQSCQDWAAKVLSVQGEVQSRKEGESRWIRVELDDTLCAGDMLRVGSRSRAAILLRNETSVRLDENTTVTFVGSDENENFLVRLMSGIAHFLSRTPKGFRVITPFVNATIGGTEFLMKVDAGEATITVFEGEVLAENKWGELNLAKGQSARVSGASAPEPLVVLRPRDAVQWALYYPPIVEWRSDELAEGGESSWQASVRRSMERYQANDLQEAFGALGPETEDIQDPRFLLYRAGLLLTVGRVEEAREDVERVLAADAGNGQGVAFLSVIELARNDKDRALRLARSSTERSPESSVSWVALSYTQQANFDLKGALASGRRAARLSPDSALVQARLAEILLSLGYLNQSVEAAQRAVQLNPHLSRTQTVLGFAHLARIRTRDARRAFEKAIRLDQADPMPRLGLGLAKIRDGRVEEGRKEIECAVILDPGNSLLRSYLGKAYFEEKKESRAGEQYETAKELDPLDPTPFFYHAVLKQTVNRPVEALQDLEKSIALNDNRAVFRSRLQLDQDLAARSVGLARIYQDLDFEQAALAEGWKALSLDPANFSAHRLLADSYSVLPRHEIARVSELLQAQLLQPLNINPVQPQLAESRLLMPGTLGPSEATVNEFSALFNRNRLAFLASGVAGEHETFGEEVVQSGLWGPFSYSLGQYHYESDGFRPNNGIKKDLYNAFAQVDVTPQTSVQAEYRYAVSDEGDLLLRFDPDAYDTEFRDKGRAKAVRFGLRHSFSPRSDFIASASYRTFELDTSLSSGRIRSDQEGYGFEAQHLFRGDRFSLITGGGYFGNDLEEELTFLPDLPFLHEADINHRNFYVYSLLNLPACVTWTLGVSCDLFDGGVMKLDREQWNPKVGVTWSPLPGTTLRAAAFRTFKRTLLSDQTLEPTQVAGFNQFYDDGEGTKAWRYGVGVDQKISAGLYAGAEYSRRDLDAPGLFGQEVVEGDLEEHFVRAYVHWTPHRRIAVSPEYQFEQFRNAGDLLANNLERLDTHRFSLGLGYYHPSGFLFRLKPSLVGQEGRFLTGYAFQEETGTLSPIIEPGDSHFFVLDAAIGYRLPKRTGIITLEGRNLFDKSFKFQDTDPASPRLIPERSILGRITLFF
ncbi:MAG: TonB-dependent receptor [Deltaproteobacteria bacterium]|nr:TonB-dependent receptor [Deltaproteobacteria bacterium]